MQITIDIAVKESHAVFENGPTLVSMYECCLSCKFGLRQQGGLTHSAARSGLIRCHNRVTTVKAVILKNIDNGTDVEMESKTEHVGSIKNANGETAKTRCQLDASCQI